MKTAAYIRVSTVGQNEAGQRLEIEKWIEGNGIKDVEWYVDHETGDHLDRPDFKRLQQNIFLGLHKTIIVYKLDRLSRTIKDGLETLCSWCDKGLRFVSVTQQIDFNGTIGKMIAAVLFGVAEMEQENRRERQAAGIQIAKTQGKYTGRKKGTTKSLPDRAKKLRDKGLKMDEIAAALGVTRMTVHRYLLNFKQLKIGDLV